MEPIPEPAGSRTLPPGFLPTRIGAGLPDEGTALIDLHYPEESSLVAEALRRLGWRTQEGSLIEAALVGGYDLVLTDAFDTLAVFLDELHPEPLAGMPDECIVCVLSDSDPKSIATAWGAGADWVVWRPFDPGDPLETRGFMP